MQIRGSWVAVDHDMRQRPTIVSQDRANQRWMGIHFGHTYTSAFIWTGDVMLDVKGPDGSHTFPTIVSYNENGETILGNKAHDTAISYPERAIKDAKVRVEQLHNDPETNKQFVY